MSAGGGAIMGDGLSDSCGIVITTTNKQNLTYWSFIYSKRAAKIKQKARVPIHAGAHLVIM